MQILAENEKVLYEVHKHWFVLFREITSIIIWALLPIVAISLIGALGSEISRQALIIFWFAYGIWILALWIKLFWKWTDYYLDIWVITDKRIIDIEQKGIFKREISTLQMDKIQDVTVEVNGLFATMFKFGNLHVQTAGEQREFVITEIKEPVETKEKIQKLQQENLD